VGSYPKTVQLKNGTNVVIRPMTADDLERSHRFFLALPADDRYMLRVDVTDREAVLLRMDPSPAYDHYRLVALAGEVIVADATLYQPRQGWKRHTAEVRAIVAHEFRDRGLGALLFHELFQEATRRKVERLYGMIMSQQEAARRIADALGFRVELVLPDQRRTLDGELHDVAVMTVSLKDLWRRLEDKMLAMDGHGRERH